MNKRVCIIYTGGTIGMVPTRDGYQPKEGYFSGELEKIRDLYSDAMPKWDLIEYDPLLDSSNIQFIRKMPLLLSISVKNSICFFICSFMSAFPSFCFTIPQRPVFSHRV